MEELVTRICALESFIVKIGGVLAHVAPWLKDEIDALLTPAAEPETEPAPAKAAKAPKAPKAPKAT